MLSRLLTTIERLVLQLFVERALSSGPRRPCFTNKKCLLFFLCLQIQRNARVNRRQSSDNSSIVSDTFSALTLGSGTVVTTKSLGTSSMVTKSMISSKTGLRSLVEMSAQPAALDVITQPRNYYKRVFENKDVNKLHKQLCNCINAAGKVSI